ncbi:DUF4932 domain-containing protein [Rufibacter immobilis]|nr:DUF4932 domain-containing protein [Rufibacter immobilis]
MVASNALHAKNGLTVEIDHRMEALSIFYTLATADTFDIKPTPSTYYKDLQEYFAPFKDHRSLNWYRNLKSWDGYDIASLGLFLSDRHPLKVKVQPEGHYIVSSPVDTFLYHFNNFYKECKVGEFIRRHGDLYRSICESAKGTIDTSGILGDIQAFYGKTSPGEFAVYLDLLNNMGNNAIPSDSKKFKGKRMFRLAYLNDKAKSLTNDDAVAFTPQLNIITQEISHLFLQSFIPSYRQELFTIRNLFLTTSKGETLKESQWENEADELIVRVCTAKILEQKFGKEKGSKEIENQSRHFRLAKPMYAFFDTYTSNRNEFKTFADFYPNLLRYLEGYNE